MTDRYAVIGNPIAHSQSPRIHAAFAAQTGQDLVYERLLGPEGRFVETVEVFRADGGRGLNVTLPFKLDAFAYAQEHSARARAAGAVNTLKFDGDRVYGDNTDGVGLTRDLEANLGVTLYGRRILVLGAGGATQGVLLPLLERHPAALVIANRTVEKAERLARDFGQHGPAAASSFEGLAGGRFDVVIDATSAAVGGEGVALPADLYAEGAVAYEMMYGKGETAFARHARACGVTRVADGLGMLVEQAAESFLLWRGVRPETAAVLTALRAGL
ncbi:MAG: shikimate dehydrogenase [Burkholderiales bacterium]